MMLVSIPQPICRQNSYFDDLSSSPIKFKTFQSGSLINQVLIFENAPSINKAAQGKGTALVNLSDGRLYFFRTSMAMLEDLREEDQLIDELLRLPEWTSDWALASDDVGHSIGAPLEFLSTDPTLLSSWDIASWKKHAMSWLVINQAERSLQEVSQLISSEADLLMSELSMQMEAFFANTPQVEFELTVEKGSYWQAMYNYSSPVNQQRRLYRRQALETFPLVMEFVHLGVSKEHSALIRNAIDEGVPIVDYLSELFHCSKGCIRHLNGLSSEQVGKRWVRRFREFLTILNSLDINRLPRDQSEWQAFGDTVDLLASMTKMPSSSVSSRLLLGELSRLRWSRKNDPTVIFQERALAIESFTEQFRLSISATAWTQGKTLALSGASAQRIAAEQACSIGLNRLEKLSRKWNAEQLRLDTESHQSNEEFPVLFEDSIEVCDISIIQLTDSKQLMAESRRMDNCVESYVAACANGKSYIFSLRNKEGRSCVTVEYSLSRSTAGLPEFLLIQQKGYKNSAPPKDCLGALKVLHSRIMSPDMRRRMLSLAVYQKANKKGGAEMARKYLRALDFINFLQVEAPSRFDFEILAEESIRLDGNIK